MAHLFVAPTGGNDSYPGTESLPYNTIQRAMSVAVAGDTIHLRGGTHYPANYITVNTSGTANQRIVMQSYAGEYAIISGVNIPYTGWFPAMLRIHGAYWTLYNFTVEDAPAEGILLQGANHIGNRLVTRRTGRSIGIPGQPDLLFTEGGAQSNVGGSGILTSAPNGHIINCDSYLTGAWLLPSTRYGGDNFFCGGEGVDVGGTVIEGCRAWNGSDDGIDLYYASPWATVRNCWVFRMGYDDDLGSMTGTPGAEMSDSCNGYKLGSTFNAPHLIHHCLAAGNTYGGFMHNIGNHDPNFRLHNCTAYRNLVQNWHNPFGHTVNCINVGSPIGDIGGSPIVSAQDSDFESVDYQQLLQPRKSDGSLPDVTAFHPKTTASFLIDVGIDLGYGHEGSAPDLGFYESGSTPPPPPPPPEPEPDPVVSPVHYHVQDAALPASVTLTATPQLIKETQVLNLKAGLTQISVTFRVSTWEAGDQEYSATMSYTEGSTVTSLAMSIPTNTVSAIDADGIDSGVVNMTLMLVIDNDVSRKFSLHMTALNGGSVAVDTSPIQISVLNYAAATPLVES